jgi:hypothetical protein
VVNKRWDGGRVAKESGIRVLKTLDLGVNRICDQIVPRDRADDLIGGYGGFAACNSQRGGTTPR